MSSTVSKALSITILFVRAIGLNSVERWLTPTIRKAGHFNLLCIGILCSLLQVSWLQNLTELSWFSRGNDL